MTKQEFEERTGLTCLNSTFDFINRIYMAAGEQDKDTFCKEWKEAMSENKIVRELTETVEALKKELNEKMAAIANLGAALTDQAKQLDNALRTQKGMTNQIESREAKIDQLRRLVNATVENVNLAVFDKLREAFENELGKAATFRMRKEAGWDLSSEDIDWLIDHCNEEDYD